MKIITIPHPSLRQTATPVEQVDVKLTQLTKGLAETLLGQRNPTGVGLAAPQVDILKRVFATNVTEDEKDTTSHFKIYINPEIVGHSEKLILGPTPKDEVLEGCLSIPGLYGPVPRFEWIEMQYQVVKGDELETVIEKSSQFEARVIQHELDHLNGILFTDYSLEYDLPVYRENEKTNKFEEVDKRILEVF